jgi:indolepyruvate ferredoxin oxidoreductase, beta subunit
MHNLKEKKEEEIMDNKVDNILMVGVGGQGIITASDILTMAALNAGYDAKKSEIHGMSQRGGSVFSHVRFGKKVFSPVIPFGQADILLSLEEMETLRWLRYTNKESRVLVMKTRILPPNVEDYPSGIEEELKPVFSNLIMIEPESLIEDIGNAKFLNVALLGLLSAYIDFPEDAWKESIKQKVPEKFYEENWQAFIKGKKLIK